jgi:pantothenate synthetase
LKERIGLVPRVTILFAGHLLLMNKFIKRIQYNTGPDSIVGVFCTT